MLAWIYPPALTPFNSLWHRFVVCMSIVNNYLISGIILFGLFFPLGLVFKLMRRDYLSLKNDPETLSYFVSVERKVDANTMRDLF